MARKSREEIQAIKEKHGVDNIYSWSKFNCYKTSQYEFLLNYIKKAEQTRASIYGISGNLIHDVIEKFYRGDIEYEDMIDEYEEALDGFNIAQLKYDRSDDKKNKKIADKYEANMRHFFKNHIPIKNKMVLEKFILIDIGDHLMQGYVDAVYKEGDIYSIVDWKSSSLYRGKKVHKEKGQLMLYALSLMQNGVPIENIEIKWNFLKYTDVTFKQKNGKYKTMMADRCEWVLKIRSRLKMDLRDIGWDNIDIELTLAECQDLNSIESLPQEVQDLYTLTDTYVTIPFTQTEIDLLVEDMVETIDEIERKTKEYELTGDDSLFWDSRESVIAESYYFANLCGFSPNQHKPYKQYLEDNQMFKKDSEKKDYDKGKEPNIDDDWMDILGL